MKRITLIATAICLIFAVPLNADIVFQINDTGERDIPTSGDTTVDVVFSYVATDSHDFFAFNIAPDVEQLGNELPTGITFNSILDLSDDFLFTTFDPTATPGVGANDIGISGEVTGDSVEVVNGSAGLLFALRFDVDSTASAGFFPVVLDELENSAFFTAVDGTTGAQIGVSSNPGGFTLNAVPEPSSLALIVAGAGGLLLRRRRG